MRFFETLLSGAALIAAVLALEINEYPTNGVQAGRTYTITYSPKDDTPTTFILRQGESGNLNTIQTITTTATGGEFEWTVPETLPNQSDYALEIRQGSVVNYSGQFPLSGGSAAVSSAASSASAARSSAASAASSALASMTSMMSSAAASVTPSASANGTTVSSATLSQSRTSSAARSSGSSGATTVPESNGAAAAFGSSPLAAILAVAGLAYLA